MRKQRLIAGTINQWPDDDEWENWTLDINPRGVWSPSLNMAVDADFVIDLSERGGMAIFRESMFDEVRLHHVLEHVGREESVDVLWSLHRILKPGGTLDIEVPNFDAAIRRWFADDFSIDELNQFVYGEDLGRNHQQADTHRIGYTPRSLLDVVEAADFTVDSWTAEGLVIRAFATPLKDDE